MREDQAATLTLMAKIRQLEQTRLHALVTANMAVADPLHADDFQLISPNGTPLTKAEYLGAIAAGELDYLVFEPASEIEVRLDGNIAVIRSRSRLEVINGGQHVPLGFYWHTDLYERRQARWQIVWSQATAIRNVGEDGKA